MVATQLFRIGLSMTCAQATFAIATPADGLPFVDAAVASQSLVMGVAQTLLCRCAPAGPGETHRRRCALPDVHGGRRRARALLTSVVGFAERPCVARPHTPVDAAEHWLLVRHL